MLCLYTFFHLEVLFFDFLSKCKYASAIYVLAHSIICATICIKSEILHNLVNNLPFGFYLTILHC